MSDRIDSLILLPKCYRCLTKMLPTEPGRRSMESEISKQAIQELTEAVRQRYLASTKEEKPEILDEFIALTKCHRKHAIRLLGSRGERAATTSPHSRRIYDEAVKESLIVLWEAAGRICDRRLKAVLPPLIEPVEVNGHTHLDPEVRDRLLRISASTIDRLLAPVRQQAKGRRKSNAPKKASKQIPAKDLLRLGRAGAGRARGAHGAALRVLHIRSVSPQAWQRQMSSPAGRKAVPLLSREQSLVEGGLISDN